MEHLHFEEQHHKLHEETEQELVSDMLDADEKLEKSVKDFQAYIKYILDHSIEE